jgi:hypothetical protein
VGESTIATPSVLSPGEMRDLANSLERGQTETRRQGRLSIPIATKYKPTAHEWKGIIDALRIAARAKGVTGG